MISVDSRSVRIKLMAGWVKNVCRAVVYHEKQILANYFKPSFLHSEKQFEQDEADRPAKPEGT